MLCNDFLINIVGIISSFYYSTNMGNYFITYN